MHSIKIKIKKINGDLEPYLLEYGKLKRIAFNYIKNNIDQKQVVFVKEIENYSKLLDRSFCGWIVQDAIQIYKSAESLNNLSPVFGGKKNLEKRRKNQLSKDEWRKLRNSYIYCMGSKNDSQGNRKIKINKEEKYIIFSPSRENKIKIELENISEVQSRILDQIINLADLNLSPITYKITREYLIIQIDELRVSSSKYKPLDNRILGLDSNPNFIGISISDFNNGKQHKIFSKVYDLRNLNKINNKNKKKFELCEISKDIIKICEHFRVKIISIEELKIESSDKKKGRAFNRLVNNNWNRILFFNNLEKRCNLSNIRLIKTPPQYSSFIGCIINQNDTDSVAASLELARRAYLYYQTFILKTLPRNTKILYPEFNISLLDRWKGTTEILSINDWKLAYNWLNNKKPRLSYRFLYDDYIKCNNLKVFRFGSGKSKIDICLY